MNSHDRSVNRLLLGVALLPLALVAASPATAQTTDANPATTDAAVPGSIGSLPAASAAPDQRPAAADTGALIVVTGSRIRRAQFDAPNPIVSLDQNSFKNAGVTNLTDFLAQYPALVGSQTSATTAGGDAAGETGLNLLNLRNLGTQRTLVLVDGRRHVSSEPGTAGVDINTIPSDLVERVDILTGGVSAIYGADGVSGVVNFILKKNFDGLSVHGQSGISSRGDAGERSFSATYGKNFADGRGNIAFAYQYGAEDQLTSYQRKRLNRLNRQVFVPNPADGDDDPNVPDRIPITDARYADSARAGALDTDFDFIPNYLGTGQPYDRGSAIYDNGDGVGGSSTPIADYGEDLQPRIRRNIFNAIAHFDISDKLTLYGEAKYVKTRSFTLGQPTFDYYLFVEPDNPYIPANLQDIIADNGGALLTRDNFDLGLRGEDISRRTIRGVAGAKGDLSPTLHYDFSFVYGQTKVTNRQIGDQYSDRFFAALDAVRDDNGKITCRANIDPNWVANQPFFDETTSRHVFTPTTFAPGDCVPINLLGEGLSDPAGVAFITAKTTDRSKLTQRVASGSISGDFRNLFSLPGGELGYALGAEYRYEGSDDVPDELVQQGLTFSPQQDITRGHFNVKEVFAELNAPIFKDRPFFKSLSVGAAFRFSDYSTVGHNTTWNVNGSWAPIPDIMFRGTYSKSVRAPNLGELYNSFQTYAFFDDPCLKRNIDSGTSTRAANCAALGIDPETFKDNRTVNIAGLSSGNPNLKAETAKTFTGGVVLRPRFLRGFNVSFDWYDIKLTKAINTVDPQRAAELCVDAPSVPNAFCGLIQRDPATQLIVAFQVEPQNVAQFRTRGLDVNLNYRLAPDWNYGVFNLQVVGNYLNKLSFVSLPGADPTNELGVSTNPSPHYQATSDLTWRIGPFSLNYGVQWWSKTFRFTRLTSSTQPDIVAPEYFKYKALWQHDLQASFTVNSQFEFYGGVNNFTGEKPGFGASSYPVSAIGRFFFAGARVKLGR